VHLPHDPQTFNTFSCHRLSQWIRQETCSFIAPPPPPPTTTTLHQSNMTRFCTRLLRVLRPTIHQQMCPCSDPNLSTLKINHHLHVSQPHHALGQTSVGHCTHHCSNATSMCCKRNFVCSHNSNVPVHDCLEVIETK
jgi:hypothetical protein